MAVKIRTISFNLKKIDCSGNSNLKSIEKRGIFQKNSLLVKLIFTGTSSKIVFTSKTGLLEQQFTTLD